MTAQMLEEVENPDQIQQMPGKLVYVDVKHRGYGLRLRLNFFCFCL